MSKCDDDDDDMMMVKELIGNKIWLLKIMTMHYFIWKLSLIEHKLEGQTEWTHVNVEKESKQLVAMAEASSTNKQTGDDVLDQEEYDQKYDDGYIEWAKLDWFLKLQDKIAHVSDR